MSTKTSFKRIALVAASALAIAGFSAVPAHATNTYGWCEVADGIAAADAAAPSATNNACNGVAGVANTVTLEFANAPASSRVTIAGAGATFGTASDTDLVIATNGLSASYGVTAADNDGTLTVNTPAVGTVTVSLFELVAAGIYESTATETITITVNATALAGGVKASTSTSIIDAGATWAGGATDDTVVVTSGASATPSSVVKVVLGRVAGAISATTKVTASISGPGLLYLNDDNDHTTTAIGSGRSLSSTVNDTTETFYVLVAPDGNAGVSTITITAGAFTTTEKVQFFGTLASLKASVKKNVRGDSNATTGAIEVIGYDKDGVVVPSVGLTITSGTKATIADYATEFSSSAAEAAAGTASVGATGITGKFGAVVLTIKDTTTKLISTTATVNVGAEEAATVTASFDKPSYSGGDLAVLTISAKDANGVPVGDTAIAVANALSITTNGAVQGTLPTSAEFKLGVQTVKFYVPLVSTTLKASINLLDTAAWATAIDGTTITAEASVEGDQNASLALDAANAATDAANNAYDEAQNATQAASDALAAVTALAAQVKSLIASVKKLTAAVAKLKK